MLQHLDKNGNELMPLVPEMPVPGSSGQAGAPDEDAVSLRELLMVIARRRWLILTTILLVFALGMFYTLLQRKVYQSKAQILVSANKGGRADDLMSLMNPMSQGRSVDTQVEIISSRDLLEKAFITLPEVVKLNDPKLQKAYLEKHFGSDILPTWAVKISSKKNTDIIDITTFAYSREAAVDLANNVAKTYFARDLEISRQATREARKYVESSLTLMEQKLDQANYDLSAFKRRYGLIAPNAQLEMLAKNISMLEAKLDEIKIDSRGNSEMLLALNRQLREAQVDIVTNTNVTLNPRFSAVQRTIDDLYVERTKLLQQYAPAAPQIKAIDAEIKEQSDRLVSIAETVIASKTQVRNPLHEELLNSYAEKTAEQASLDAQINAVQAAVIAAQTRAQVLPERERQLTQLLRSMERNSKTVDMLTEKYYTLLTSERSTISNGNQVTEARQVKTPVRPRPIRNAIMFLLLGAAIAAVLVVVAERLDDRVHDQETVERISNKVTLTGIPEIAVDEPKLLHQVARTSPILESFRVLRNNITFMSIDRPLKTLAITSVGPSEGKTLANANLAIVLAMDGKRVLIVDCDLHRPNMHNVLNRSRDVGFTSVLTEACTLEKAIVPDGHSGSRPAPERTAAAQSVGSAEFAPEPATVRAPAGDVRHRGHRLPAVREVERCADHLHYRRRPALPGGGRSDHRDRPADGDHVAESIECSGIRDAHQPSRPEPTALRLLLLLLLVLLPFGRCRRRDSTG